MVIFLFTYTCTCSLHVHITPHTCTCTITCMCTFVSLQINKEWRVVTTYADKKYTQPVTNPHTRVPLEARPRPLEFDEQAHKSLNSELKYLYTAITRAKCNLWIYDSSETRRLPMFDYWVRRGLVRVVRLGETEEDDSVLFTATSTPEQWQQQGDYFRRKGLWEPAMKCYHKSGSELQEREAEAYLHAQKARQSKNLREVIGLFENAAVAFLCCDRIKHDVKFLNNAAKCLKNSKRHSDAARLFEKLGQVMIRDIIYDVQSRENQDNRNPTRDWTF